MKKFIFPPKVLFAMLLVVGFISLVQGGVAMTVERWTKVAESQCTFKSWSEGGGSNLRLNLDCQGKEAWTQSGKTILEYLEKPRPLTCSLWTSGEATCEISK